LAFLTQTFKLTSATLLETAEHSVRRVVVICLLSAVLAACEAYEPAPLDSRPDLLRQVAALTISRSNLPFPELAIDFLVIIYSVSRLGR
jgi:hypothetical protein